MCGEQQNGDFLTKRMGGSPPRVRGTDVRSRDTNTSLRITPACAGNRQAGAPVGIHCQDHPRVCGEQLGMNYQITRGTGSPPRVRGTGRRTAFETARRRITPACAGNRCMPSLWCLPRWDHPRVCGEQFSSLTWMASASGSPPRVRGTAAARSALWQGHGITPACAGNSAEGHGNGAV